CRLAASAAQLLIEQRWGLLLQLETADRQLSLHRDALLAEAAQRYRASSVWFRYMSASRARRFPAVRRVAVPVCDLCSISLPSRTAAELMRGEAVVCERGVNGHVDVPSGGREISPYTVMSSAPPAAMRFPQ